MAVALDQINSPNPKYRFPQTNPRICGNLICDRVDIVHLWKKKIFFF